MYYAISKPVTSKSSQSCTTVLFAVETEVSADVGPLQNVALTEECVLSSSRIDHDRVKKISAARSPLPFTAIHEWLV